jgi:hypothetical protein
MLRNEKAQAVLAALAAHPKVRFLKKKCFKGTVSRDGFGF